MTESDGAPKSSQSSRLKAKKPGDKLYRPFGYDDPGASLQGLIERHGALKMAKMFCRLTGCQLILPAKFKTDKDKQHG